MGSLVQEDSRTPRVRGRPFPKNNFGRPPGSKNRRTRVLGALLQGDEEELLCKAKEMAKAGDGQMLRFLLGRTLPRERLVRIDLPKIEFADDAVEALGAIVRAVSEGSITPGEGVDLANLVNSCSRAIDIADLVKRMDGLEARISGSA
jgi:hypothetical protein